ncbi:MAG: Flp pilus assembly complex ATPase component TadA [Gammaproteobacteria bacterium]|nr:Flp pilus assembly complex ATPase component TadA [Gammaproteobacteria bacterium]
MGDYSSLFTGKAAAGEADNAGNTPPAKREPYRLLLVDDEPNVVKALLRVFRQENYQISYAANGQEALKLLEREKFQVMISDYLMPVMNGADLLRQAKAVQPDMIRIMLTGHADTAAVMAAIKDGAVYKFILKPWDDDDLRVTVALALEQYELIRKNRQLKKDNVAQSREIDALAKMAVTNRSQLAIMLHKRNLLNNQQVQELHKLQQGRKEPIIGLLLEKEWVTEKVLRDILRKDLLVEEVALAEFALESAVAALVPKAFCKRQLVVPLRLDGRRLLLAVADPLDAGMLDELRFVSGLELQVAMADVADIRQKVAEVYGEGSVSIEDLEAAFSGTDPFDGIEVVIEDEDDASLEELLRGTEEPPAVRLVNAVILEAIRLGASDIHIHPRAKSVMVRYRIDGVLSDKIQIPHSLHTSIVSRIKVMAELDITERRRPQDGRIAIKTPLRIVDLRISTLPTINGEKVVMRILDRNAAVHSITELGLSPVNLAKIERMVEKPQGIVLATGPTGSGKTTTLYSLLQHNATATKNYVTIEDPVEYYMDMAGQVYVKEKTGLNFATVLRSILRQDPDVILLGEIRDFETAEVAFHAALTGHLVYSTLHTNSAVATIARLFDLGLKPYVVATALEGIVAQRLVRRICPDCRTPQPVDARLLNKLGPRFDPEQTATYVGTGCDNCHGSGYRGRIALHEVLVPDERVRQMIASGVSPHELGKAVAQLGFATLIDDARLKVHEGLTTAEEILRVLGPQESAD